MIVLMIVFIAVTKTYASEEINDCYDNVTMKCCEGYVLQTGNNQTTATCIKCIAPGLSCYQTNQTCCSGFRCGSGGPVYSEPRPTDRCISNSIIG
jgi:hypothetical protein